MAPVSYTHLDVYKRQAIDQPVVKARLNPFGEGLEVMVYTQDQTDLFLRMVGFFSRTGYSICLFYTPSCV